MWNNGDIYQLGKINGTFMKKLPETIYLGKSFDWTPHFYDGASLTWLYLRHWENIGENKRMNDSSSAYEAMAGK